VLFYIHCPKLNEELKNHGPHFGAEKFFFKFQEQNTWIPTLLMERVARCVIHKSHLITLEGRNKGCNEL